MKGNEMSKKTILLTAVLLAVLLAASVIGYKVLTAKQEQAAQTGKAAASGEASGSSAASVAVPEDEDPEAGSAEEPAGEEDQTEEGPSVDLSGQEQAEEEMAADTSGQEGPAEEEMTAESSEQEFPQAPDFTVFTMDGEEVRLGDFLGKPVIINFWASWCPPCKAELPDFQEYYNEYGDQIEFLMVDLTDGAQETKATASAFLLQNGYTFPVYLDEQTSAALAYGLYSIPVTVAVDEEGRLKTQRVGAMNKDQIGEIIDLLIG